jgi:hypothetical protein
MKKNTYTVVVGNIGTMDYTSKKLALECFNTYVSLSKSGEGRAAYEPVTLFINGEIDKEYLPELSDNTKAIISDLRSQIDRIIKDANNNADCKGFAIVFGNFSINIPEQDRDGFWEEMDTIGEEHSLYFMVNDYNDLCLTTDQYEAED